MMAIQTHAQAPIERAAPAQQPLPSLRALAWLYQQPEDIMDACLRPLSRTERAHLGLAWHQGTAGLPQPHRHRAQALAARLAASNHDAFAATVACGPLKPLLLAALEALGPPRHDAPQWLAINSRRLLLEDKLVWNHRGYVRAYATCLSNGIPKDNTAAILALDALTTGAPDAMGQACTPAPPWGHQTTEQRRRPCGLDALLYAAFFGEALQDTLLADLIVGTALSYLGHLEAATKLLSDAVATRLPEALTAGQGDRGHPFFGELNGHATSPWCSLGMIQVAALAGNCAALFEIYQQARSFVPTGPRQNADKTPFRGRWQALGHPLEREDRQAVLDKPA